MLTDAAALTGISGMTPRPTDPATLKPPEPPPPPTLWARMPSEYTPLVKILLFVVTSTSPPVPPEPPEPPRLTPRLAMMLALAPTLKPPEPPPPPTLWARMPAAIFPKVLISPEVLTLTLPPVPPVPPLPPTLTDAAPPMSRAPATLKPPEPPPPPTLWARMACDALPCVVTALVLSTVTAPPLPPEPPEPPTLTATETTPTLAEMLDPPVPPPPPTLWARMPWELFPWVMMVLPLVTETSPPPPPDPPDPPSATSTAREPATAVLAEIPKPPSPPPPPTLWARMPWEWSPVVVMVLVLEDTVTVPPSPPSPPPPPTATETWYMLPTEPDVSATLKPPCPPPPPTLWANIPWESEPCVVTSAELLTSTVPPSPPEPPDPPMATDAEAMSPASVTVVAKPP